MLEKYTNTVLTLLEMIQELNTDNFFKDKEIEKLKEELTKDNK